jgi:nucleoside-diphosphate-sugar epimerase
VNNDINASDLEYIVNNLKNELSSIANKKILITGGAGFLGYYLVQTILDWNKRFPEQSIDLTIYDNFVRGFPEWLKTLEGNNHLTIITHDITNSLPEDIEAFQYIIHAASIASPTFYRKFPIETMDANVNGLRLLLDYANKQKQKNLPIQGFLFFSTSEIYGDPSPENIPTPETYNGNVSCTGPRACYDESKRYGETLCVNFAENFDLPIKVARPFNNYGPGLKITDKRVIPDFAKDILANRNIVMFSNGSPTRTFCYIADAIVGYFKVLINGKKGEAYNIGIDRPEISIKVLADKIVSIASDQLGYKGSVIQKNSEDKDYMVDNPNRRLPDISKARRDLGFDPQISLEDGLMRTLTWYSNNREAEEK